MDKARNYTTGVAAAKDYFGSPTAQAFMAEWKALTPEDKAEIIEGLRKEGYEIAQSPQA